MNLTPEQRERLRSEHGVCVNEACDRCSRVLGPVRYTIKDQPGEWCSRYCRNGVEPRAVLVRRKHATVEDRAAARRSNTAARMGHLRQRKTALQTTPNQIDISVTFESQALPL